MKTKRQEMILDIIQNNRIETQEDLTRMLREAGFAVTQATVSRDIKELRLIKTLGEHGRYHYTVVQSSRGEEATAKLQTLFRDAVHSVDHACNIVVVKTLGGTAGAVCTAIDSMSLSSIVGSLAGDDTIMLVVRSEAEATVLCRQLRQMAGQS